MKKTIFIVFTLLSCVNFVYSQNKTIQGKVIDETLYPLIGILIFNDSVCIGQTDFDGNFQIEVPSSVNRLTFSYIDMEDADLELSDDCNVIELIMIGVGHYDMSWNKAKRVRRKRYKELPKIHKEAYEKGIFQSPKPCYIQECDFQKFVKWDYKWRLYRK